MSSYKEPDLEERQRTTAKAKTAMLKKFRAAAEDPAVGEATSCQSGRRLNAAEPSGRRPRSPETANWPTRRSSSASGPYGHLGMWVSRML
jgi:hypothetical protein